MSEVTPKLNKQGLSQVWSLIVAGFVSNSVLTPELIGKLKNVNENAQENVIESITVNGTTCEVTEKGISLTIPTGTLADLDEVGISNLSAALVSIINGKADAATTLAGYGITDAYTKSETYSRTEADSAISTAVGQAVAGVYKVKGSVAFASLPTENVTVGDVYNITDAFTASDAFVTSEVGKEYPAGTNVCYTENGWDAMAGTYDFSAFIMKDDLVDITAEEIDEICVIPKESVTETA